MWDSIGSIISAKIVASTSLWIFVVPVLVKLSIIFGFSITVPPDFFMLYFAALSFFIASIIYILACPSFLRQYKSFGDFHARKQSTFDIQQNIDHLNRAESAILKEKVKINVDRIESKQLDEKVDCIEIGTELLAINFYKTDLPKIFAIVRSYFLNSRKFAQTLCVLFLLLGMLCLSLVLLRNLGIVIDYVFLYDS